MVQGDVAGRGARRKHRGPKRHHCHSRKHCDADAGGACASFGALWGRRRCSATLTGKGCGAINQATLCSGSSNRQCIYARAVWAPLSLFAVNALCFPRSHKSHIRWIRHIHPARGFPRPARRGRERETHSQCAHCVGTSLSLSRDTQIYHTQTEHVRYGRCSARSCPRPLPSLRPTRPCCSVRTRGL